MQTFWSLAKPGFRHKKLNFTTHQIDSHIREETRNDREVETEMRSMERKERLFSFKALAK